MTTMIATVRSLGAAEELSKEAWRRAQEPRGADSEEQGRLHRRELPIAIGSIPTQTEATYATGIAAPGAEEGVVTCMAIQVAASA